MPQAKCVSFCGRIQAQCITVEITSDGIARKICSLFSTMVLYFAPMKAGEEKSHSRVLKSLDDVLGCFYSLSMRASFSSFHSSCFVHSLLSFQDFKKRPQRSHWSWLVGRLLEITLLAPQSFVSGSCHQQLPDHLCCCPSSRSLTPLESPMRTGTFEHESSFKSLKKASSTSFNPPPCLSPLGEGSRQTSPWSSFP